MYLVYSILALSGATGSDPDGNVDTTRIRAAYEAARRYVDSIDAAHRRVIHLGDLAMEYLEWGPPTGTPIIWLHGSAGNAHEFRHLGPRLGASGFRVLAPSYRGHGRSTTANYQFSIYHVADDIAAMMDSLRIGRAILGGTSKGGFVAAAMYDQYRAKVSGLLLSDGGSWSNQWEFDHHGLEGAKRQVSGGGPPRGVGATEWDLFLTAVGPMIARATTTPPTDRVADMLLAMSVRPDGRYELFRGFDQMMGDPTSYLASATAPSKLPLLQWSQHAMIPEVVFRRLAIPVTIIDPQSPTDELDVTDQNERLASRHPRWIVHRIYPQTGHAAFRERPEWFVRDAIDLRARVAGQVESR